MVLLNGWASNIYLQGYPSNRHHIGPWKYVVFALCTVSPFAGRASIWQHYEWKRYLIDQLWFDSFFSKQLTLHKLIHCYVTSQFNLMSVRGSPHKWLTVQRVNSLTVCSCRGEGDRSKGALVFWGGYHSRERTFKMHSKHIFFRSVNSFCWLR